MESQLLRDPHYAKWGTDYDLGADPTVEQMLGVNQQVTLSWLLTHHALRAPLWLLFPKR